MLFIITNGQNVNKVPGAEEQEVDFFHDKVFLAKHKVWVADLSAEQLASLCRQSGGHIAIEDRSVKEYRTNSLGAVYLLLW